MKQCFNDDLLTSAEVGDEVTGVLMVARSLKDFRRRGSEALENEAPAGHNLQFGDEVKVCEKEMIRVANIFSELLP